MTDEIRAPAKEGEEGLTLDECFAWMVRYRSEPFNMLPLAIAAAGDVGPATVFASLGWHAQRLKEALERIASNEAFGTPGVLGRGWADNEARQRMEIARASLK